VADEPIGADRAKARLIHTFTGDTDAGQQLKFDFPKDTCARCVQIRTTQSPSWIAWGSVELHVGPSRVRLVTE
jgi:hypothetical protein